ncbi:hypothetical protein M1P56_20045 [Streptomyces sp. HU2014]|nr:hypothetical protein [Streptomyces sp. HU2014]UQI46475.1 hypothetical protein M1P56_20045 [Streptomyces sp. HU2014]
MTCPRSAGAQRLANDRTTAHTGINGINGTGFGARAAAVAATRQPQAKGT